MEEMFDHIPATHDMGRGRIQVEAAADPVASDLQTSNRMTDVILALPATAFVCES